MIRTVKLKKGEILQHKGDKNNHVYKVVSGLLRSYIIDDKGKEYIFMFAPEGWRIADAGNAEIPCELFIDALEDSTVKIIEKDLNEPKNVPALISHIGGLQKRIMMLMSTSAIERYEHFIKTYPDLSQRIPQRMIASYLGITPEALSKVKGDKARGI